MMIVNGGDSRACGFFVEGVISSESNDDMDVRDFGEWGFAEALRGVLAARS
jgi:hypothetical protein